MGERISLVEAVQVLNEAYGNNPKKSGRNVISIRTIYNAISAKKLQRFGRARFAQVDRAEVLKLFGPRTA